MILGIFAIGIPVSAALAIRSSEAHTRLRELAISAIRDELGLEASLGPVQIELFPFGIVRLLWYRRSIDAARVLTLGLKAGYRNKGLDALLIQHIWRECVRAGHPKGECSWILEDNQEMRRGIERSGGRAYKTYRVFEKPLPD